jgi:oligopeptide transport system permease protein
MLLGERLASPRSQWRTVWRQFCRHRLAVASLGFLIILIFVGVFAPVIAPQDPVHSDVRQAATFRKAAWIDHPDPRRAGDWKYPLGTDSVGRDVLSRLVFGTRVMLVIGFAPLLLILTVGVPIGLIAGFSGGWVDNFLMRLTDLVYAFPALLFFLVVQVAFREAWIGELWNGLALLCLSLSLVSWTGVARVVRGETLEVAQQEYIEAARVNGATRIRIIRRHVVPNILGTVLTVGAFLVPGAIVAEIVLGFLGIGIQPDVRPGAVFPVSWGTMILEGSKGWQSQEWLLIGPCLAVALVTLAFTFLGDGLRQAFDPEA